MPQSAIDQTDNKQSDTTRIDPCDIAGISHDLFESMLGMEFVFAPGSPRIKWDNPVMASIQIEGDWNAEFRVIASLQLASEIACTMFETNGEDISQDEIFDAMGEIVNVVGGNAKGIIDGECQLSIPCVGLFDEERKSPQTHSLNFVCNGQLIEIQLNDHDLT